MIGQANAMLRPPCNWPLVRPQEIALGSIILISGWQDFLSGERDQGSQGIAHGRGSKTTGRDWDLTRFMTVGRTQVFRLAIESALIGEIQCTIVASLA